MPNILDPVDICLINIKNNLALDAQRQISRYREIDHRHKHILNKIETVRKLSSDKQLLETLLIELMDLSNEKLHITNSLQNMVGDNMFELNKSVEDHNHTQVRQKKSNNTPNKTLLKSAHDYENSDSPSTETLSISSVTSDEKLSSSAKRKFSGALFSESDEDNNSESQRSKSETPKNSKSSDSTDSVEPTYCLCENISYGNMVCCDNDLCPIEWFHFSCVALTRKPKGKWYCPKCRGTNSKRMKARKTFLKELKEYNKQKEESFN